MAIVRSYGATKEVTGSCHVLEVEDVKIMIDCGMFQGEEEEKNKEAFYFEPSTIDYILITHAHLDHIGRIPKLVKEGFTGKIYATSATMELAEIILMDSAKIMSEDFQTRYRKAQRRGQSKRIEKPLYDPINVEETFDMIEWVNPEYNQYYDLCEGISFVYRNAGHILGSAFIEISYMDNNDSHTIVFSGDIGNNNDLVLPHLAKCEKADCLYVETTYGERNHQPIDATIKEFKETLLATLDRGGNVLIPSFALERTQELLCILRDMYEKGELPKCKVFLDSPMATRATQVYKQYARELIPKCQDNIKENGSVFNFELLSYTETPEASKSINDIKSRAIIIAGAGMCNGGRIVHHFKHRIWDKNNAVIFVGFQAENTLGREIVDGAQWINVLGEDIIVQASIHTINGFSAHADRDGILEWIADIKGLKKVILVHGEIESQNAFKEILKEKLGLDSHIVSFKEKVLLD
ncbi:MBL fold metallo-hydrolase [Sulfurimonas sp. C5]|uniref:MBL fold metallo-hydrolase RNA specificity domain-containing protein n=1 Tax=Sulfurimonas sp. C5 TaxID=3036947 RepID=UPI002455BB6A|nr:MBL fold metallo-hydrolase [Sulfurimonas sp. C5]MDH4944021.1 MBL fold metallo-hydrolase [Sulfurimonas sp. C5]